MAEPTSLDVEHDLLEGADVLRVSGELDLTNTDRLRVALETTELESVVLDLCNLSFLDSAGIRAVDAERRRLRESGRTLYVVAPPDSRAAWTFRIAGFDSDLVLTSLEAASRLIDRRRQA